MLATRKQGSTFSDRTGRIHSAFTVVDPDGYRVTVNSSHVVGEV